MLHRGGGRCQSCSAMLNLEVHHKQFRSTLGPRFRRKLNRNCASLAMKRFIPSGARLGPECQSLEVDSAQTFDDRKHTYYISLTTPDLPTMPNASCWRELQRIKLSRIAWRPIKKVQPKLAKGKGIRAIRLGYNAWTG